MGRLTKETIAQLKEFVCYHRTLCDDAICRKEEGCFVNWAIEGLQELQHYKDLEEQGRLIDRDKLIMSIADWQMTLSPANNEADVFEYNVLESVIEHIAELKELEGVKE